MLKEARENFFVNARDFTSSKLELFTSAERGRGYRTTQDIRPGELLFVTKSLAVCLNSDIEDYGV